jgi:hypothetical protein
MRCTACNRYINVRYTERGTLEDLCNKCLRISTQVLYDLYTPEPEYTQMNNVGDLTGAVSGFKRVSTKSPEEDWDNPDGFHRSHSGGASKLFDKIKD